MAVGLTTFFGGGRDLGTPSDLQLYDGDYRVLTTAGGSVRLPNTATRRPGFPQFLIVNVSGSCAVKDSAGSTLHTITSAQAVMVGLNSNKVWVISDDKPFSQGPDI